MKKPTLESMSNKVRIIVPSCDAYADLWDVFETFFLRYWPDCPLEVSLITNKKQPESKLFNVIIVGEDKDWSSNLIKALVRVKEPYVLLLLDDLILTQYVNNGRVNNALNWVISQGFNYLRFCPRSYKGTRYNILGIGEITKKSFYRASTVGCLWKKEVLVNLLKEGETAWEFEHYGSIRSNRYDHFYITKDRFLPLINSVIRGKWHPDFLNFLKREGFVIQSGSRTALTCRETAKHNLLRLRSTIFSKLPSVFQCLIKKTMN